MHPVLCTNTHHDVKNLVNHGMIKNIQQGLTIIIKSPYVITYVCQNFDVRDIRGQIPKKHISGIITFT